MNIDLHLAKRYIRHLTESAGANKLHSPFAYEFFTNVLEDERRYYSFLLIEKRRKRLLRDRTLIEVTELGAGSRVQHNAKRRISEIARHAAKRPKYCRLLFRIVNYFNPKHILELGTSLGISTSYLASARSHSTVTTLEGSPEIAQIAKSTFKKLHLDNIRMINGDFDDTLEGAVQEMPALDLAFIDGNHRQEPTLRYFETCLSKVHNNSILIFDDINWTVEMEEAWETIKAHPAVTLTIDTFYFGMVFFRKEIKEKQHFKFRY